MGNTNAPIIPHRRKQLLMPDRNAGGLLGAIRETQAKPGRSDAFFIGTGFTFTAPRGGKLYFAVNDVWDDDDPAFADKFFIDNVGFFYAKVTVKPGK